MTPLTVGELLAIFAIVSTSRSPRAKELAARVREVYLVQSAREEEPTP